MKNFLTFAETVQELNIMERHIIPLLKKGLQPYLQYAPMEKMPCPPNHHEYYILSKELQETERLIEALSVLRVVLTQIKKEGKVEIETPLHMVEVLGKLHIMLPEKQQKGIPLGVDKITLSLENTYWIKGEMLNQLEDELNQNEQKLANRVEKINTLDPYKNNWRYLVEPYLGDLDWFKHLFSNKPSPVWMKDIWPDGEIDELMSDVQKCYFNKSDIEKLINPKKKKNARSWYSWNDETDTLTITATGESFPFKNQGANVIRLFIEADKNKKQDKKYSILKLSTIKNAVCDSDQPREMRSFFQNQPPYWKKIIHKSKERVGYFYFGPPKEKS